ncbi:hypothetical protein TYRP_009116 [Tyrophagus putrescentiae]|nr:hypothetical protein TYRP_009116 [Tyrophagus putrescentiae]
MVGHADQIPETRTTTPRHWTASTSDNHHLQSHLHLRLFSSEPASHTTTTSSAQGKLLLLLLRLQRLLP